MKFTKIFGNKKWVKFGGKKLGTNLEKEDIYLKYSPLKYRCKYLVIVS